jgi:hypothetical protein
MWGRPLYQNFTSFVVRHSLFVRAGAVIRSFVIGGHRTATTIGQTCG